MLKFCRFCQGTNLSKILDLGDVPLAGGFITEEGFQYEKYYPLSLNFCLDCYLVQVSAVISADKLFKNNYFFFSSAIGTLITHFEAFAKEIHERFLEKKDSPSVLEIGCNDGVLLRPFSALGVRAIGVDPATNVVQKIDPKDATVVNDYFTEKVATDIKETHGKVDAIVSSFSFAHIDDMVDVMKGIDVLLNEDGVFIFEIYYLGILLEEMHYDMIYHEHMSYYSVITLKKFLARFDMEIFDVKYIPGVRSGSVRFYARRIGRRPEVIAPIVKDMIQREYEKGLDKESAYFDYAKKVENTRTQLMELLGRLKKEGKTIIGYGASGRGTVIMNYCGIDNRYLDYVVDDAPSKHGFFTPGTHVPIKPWDFVGQTNFPDYAVLFAWSFTEEVLLKRQDYIEKGGKFIVPLPDVRICPK